MKPLEIPNLSDGLPMKTVGRKHQPVVYFATSKYGGAIKIGTTVNLRNRLYRFNRGRDIDMRYLAVIAGGQDEEKRLHRKFAPCRINGVVEYFWPAPELLDFIESVKTDDSENFLRWAMEYKQVNSNE